MSPTVGYSGTPLPQKLGIKPGATVLAIGWPRGYRKLLAPVPQGVKVVSRLSPATDIVHAFTTRKSELKPLLAMLRGAMRKDAAIWVSWPKKSAGVLTDVTEDVVRELALPLGLVDIKVCAVDDVWSGLKLMIRKELR